jgi:hypothetical protein
LRIFIHTPFVSDCFARLAINRILIYRGREKRDILRLDAKRSVLLLDRARGGKERKVVTLKHHHEQLRTKTAHRSDVQHADSGARGGGEGRKHRAGERPCVDEIEAAALRFEGANRAGERPPGERRLTDRRYDQAVHRDTASRCEFGMIVVANDDDGLLNGAQSCERLRKKPKRASAAAGRSRVDQMKYIHRRASAGVEKSSVI